MERLLAGLRAAAEPTRLRILLLCGRADLTVTELTQILGQSQPRVSRHLKLLCDAGLLARYREGSWAFFRAAGEGAEGALVARLLELVPEGDDGVARDLARLEAVRASRAEAAAAFFRANAAEWDSMRRLYVAEADVESALGEMIPEAVDDYLDIGTGTGRLLQVFGPRAERAVGVDASREMLSVARANLDAAGLRHCQVRQGDMYQLPLPSGGFDLVTIHQVLHYADDPARVLDEAARVLRPAGRLIVADFAPHGLEALRDDHAHRRLGFADKAVAGWLRAAGLKTVETRHLPGDPLTVTLWLAERPRTARVPRAAALADDAGRTVQ